MIDGAAILYLLGGYVYGICLPPPPKAATATSSTDATCPLFDRFGWLYEYFTSSDAATTTSSASATAPRFILPDMHYGLICLFAPLYRILWVDTWLHLLVKNMLPYLHLHLLQTVHTL